MSNISNLFENLMTYNEANKPKKSTPIMENDSTLLNLTVELPSDTEDITPEDIKVDVGVMSVDTTDVEDEDQTDTNDEEIVDEESNESEDVTPEDEDVTEPDDNAPEKEESLKMRKEAIRKKRLEAKTLREAKKDCTGKEDCECESCNSKKESIEESADVETAKSNIRKRVLNTSTEECVDTTVVKEALMHLDTKSLNKLITEFVKENYKNIDKVTITKAVLENRHLVLEGIITNENGESEKISLTNNGFNPIKLEGKRFEMDFKDSSNTFNVVKENVKQPFLFTCTLQEGVLKFEELKYSFKTKINESKTAKIYGKCVLTETKEVINESTEAINENADQVKKFNEIVDKIKAAKTANDLSACKDEMDDANLGDTLLSAAQMVWDDVNSRMRVQ